MEKIPARILLATDGSEDSQLACLAATDLAARAGAELHVAHAYTPSYVYTWPYSLVKLDDAALHREDAQRLLADEVGRIEGRGGVVAGSYLREGLPAEEIVAVARRVGADLVTMGGRGHGALRRLTLGSVAEGVAHHAPCPVLILRGAETAWPPDRVVVGEDGSEEAAAAGGLAARISELYGVGLELVCAYRPPHPRWPGGTDGRHAAEEAAEGAMRMLGERADALVRAGAVRPAVRLLEGDPAVALVKLADGSGRPALLCVGERRTVHVWPTSHAGVADRVLRVGTGPVLLVPRPEAPATGG